MAEIYIIIFADNQHWTILVSPPPLKMETIGLRHVLSWPKLGLEPKFHDPGWDFWWLR